MTMASDKNPNMIKEVKKVAQAELTEKYRKKLEMERASRLARIIEECEKDRKYIDPDTGHEVDRWEEVIRKSRKIIVDAQMSYNDWRASMSTLIALYSNLNQALAQSEEELGSFLVHSGLNEVKPYTLDRLVEAFSGPPEVTLPKLQYLVEVGADNKLTIHSLKRYEGDDLGDAANDLFKTGVEKWLDEMNYKPSSVAGQWVHKDTGVTLKKADFELLKKGLAKLLSEHFSMEFEERPGPQIS